MDDVERDRGPRGRKRPDVDRVGEEGGGCERGPSSCEDGSSVVSHPDTPVVEVRFGLPSFPVLVKTVGTLSK